MMAHVPKITVPAGQWGKYLCKEGDTHGVSKGPDSFYRVLCMANGSYAVPTEWPVCQPKTTTVSPGMRALP